MSHRASAPLAAALLLCSLAGAAAPVRAVATLPPDAEPAASAFPVSPAAVLRTGFVQERRLPGFRQPLRSEGKLLLVRGEGLRWEVQVPFPSTTILQRGRLRLLDAEGREQASGAEAGASLARLLQSLLEALLSADRKALAVHFVLEEAPAPREGAWALVLTPVDPLLATVFRRIEVEGAAQVESLRLEEREGVEVLLRFHDTRTLPVAGETERRAFD